MYFVIAFAEIQLAEDFCNGIPLSYTVGGIPQYTDPMTDSAVFALAAAQADSGLALATGTDAATTQVKNALLDRQGTRAARPGTDRGRRRDGGRRFRRVSSTPGTTRSPPTTTAGGS